MIDFRRLWFRAISPEKGFQQLALESPRMAPSLGRLLTLRGPVAFAEALLMYWGFLGMYRAFAGMDGPLWNLVLHSLPPDLSVEDIHSFLQELPPLPGLDRVWPWLLAAAPLYVLSLWIHDAVWDHGCLWMLGGLREKRGFRMTLIAESEALQVGVFGAILGLLTSLPGIGWMLSLPIGLVGVYFWILRGFSLAAFHGCAVWKGVVATLLHVFFAACCVSATLLLFFLLLTQALA